MIEEKIIDSRKRIFENLLHITSSKKLEHGLFSIGIWKVMDFSEFPHPYS